MEDFCKLVITYLVETRKYNDVKNNFAHLTTDQKRVRYILNIICKSGFIPNAAKNWLKNDEESEELRKEGNNIFAEFCDNFDDTMCHKALTLYTKSIALAPPTSKQLPLTYADRSAILLELGLYSECIQDIDRALNLNYPDDLKGKLYLRKTICLIILGDRTANSMIEETRYWINKMTLDSYKLELHAKLDVLCQKIEQKDIQINSAKLEKSESDSALPVIRSYSKEVPCASDAVTIKYDAHNGRHVVAARDIDVGEVLTVEEPYSLLLDQENALEHCSNCLRVCWAIVPCKYCSYAMYCSEQCRDIEWSKCHNVECAFISFFNDNTHDLFLFSLRLAVLAVKEAGDIQSLRTMLKEAEKNKNDPRTMGFSPDGRFHSNKYTSIYSLERNTEKRSLLRLLIGAVHTCFILYALAKHTMFFGAKLPGDFSALATNKNVTFIGGLILRHQQIITINFLRFKEERDLGDATRGLAVTAFCSLFNHSCRPNVYITSRPQHVVSYAVFPIKKGEQLLCAYDSTKFTLWSRLSRRQRLMEQYHFFCTCVACDENWPMEDDHKSLLDRSRTQAKPDDEVIMMDAIDKYENYFPLVKAGDILDKPYILEDFLMIIRVLHDRVPIDCPLLNAVSEALEWVYDLHGNKFVLPTIQARDI